MGVVSVSERMGGWVRERDTHTHQQKKVTLKTLKDEGKSNRKGGHSSRLPAKRSPGADVCVVKWCGTGNVLFELGDCDTHVDLLLSLNARVKRAS